MRKNLSVTNEEIQMAHGQMLITKTNTRGVIAYANQAFINISGNREEELVGAPHNLIRHSGRLRVSRLAAVRTELDKFLAAVKAV